MKVVVLTISTKYGNDVWAFSSHEKAEDRLYRYVQEYWNSSCDGDCPESRTEAVEAYFNEIEFDEYYSICEVTVDATY